MIRLMQMGKPMAVDGTEIKQREPAIAETEQRIVELEQQLEKGLSLIHIFSAFPCSLSSQGYYMV